MKHHCINLDWLEVYCIEPTYEPITPEYFERKGYKLHVREYGTPIYRQMFTIYDNTLPLIEVRRDPYSVKVQGGILERGSVHLRLTNRACYRPEPVNDLRNFIIAHNLTFRGITRLDIAFDFQKFDNNMLPRTLIQQLFADKVAKINQCNISAHGKDAWDGQTWNSVKWGSETSAVSTKLYNKTLELRTHASKYYIIDAWAQAGLAKQGVCLDANGQIKTKVMSCETTEKPPQPEDTIPDVEIWRIEFAIKTEARNWLRTDTGEIFELRLSNIDTRDKLLFLWRALATHYFHFKRKTYTRDGQPQRKDRCPDLNLSKATTLERAYTVYRNVNQPDPTRTERILIKKLQRIAELEENTTELDKMAALRVVQYLERTRQDAILSPLAAKLHDDLQNYQLQRDFLLERTKPADLPSFEQADLYDYPTDYTNIYKVAPIFPHL